MRSFVVERSSIVNCWPPGEPSRERVFKQRISVQVVYDLSGLTAMATCVL